MKILALLCLLLFIGTLSAELAWQEPISVVSFENIEYRGNSLQTADGCHLLMWWQNYSGHTQYFLRLFDTQYQPLWEVPLPIYSAFDVWDLVETSDSCFVLTYGDSQGGIRALRISRTSEFMWGPQGISIFSTYWSEIRSDLIADMMGGVYFAWCGVSNSGARCAMQHIDAAGNLTMQSNGMIIESPSRSYYVSLLTLPDNSVVVNWTIANMIKMQRVNSSGEFMWAEAVCIASDYYYPYGVFCAFTDATFALCIGNKHYLDVHRFDHSGGALWSQAVTALSVNWIESSTIRAVPGVDNSLFITTQAESGAYLQNVSADGVIQFPGGLYLGYLNSMSPVIPDDFGGCIVVGCSYVNPRNVHAILVNTMGDFIVYQITDNSNYKEKLSASKYGGSIYLDWCEREPMRRGVKGQILDLELQPQLELNGRELAFGNSGKVQGSQNAARTNGSSVIWQQSSLYSTHWDLYLQIVTTHGQPLLGDGGIKINSEGSDLMGSYVVRCNGNHTMVEWGEMLGGVSSKRYQIIDENGNILLPQGGNRIGSSDQTVGVVSVNTHDGYWYIFYSVSNTIWGQKHLGTQAIWGNGVQITQPHPEIGGDIYSCNFEYPWLTWSFGFWPSSIYLVVACINESGTLESGFPLYGVALPTQDGTYPLYEYKITNCGANLHVVLHFAVSHYPDLETTYIYKHTLISPEGEFLFPLEELPVASYYNVFSINNDLYIGEYGSNYIIRRYDTSGNIIGSHTVPASPLLPGGGEILGSKHLSNGDLMFLAKRNQQTSPYLVHFFISPEWVMNVPEDNFLFTVNSYYPPCVSLLDDRAWVSTLSGGSNNSQFTSVLLQGTGMEGVANPDDDPQAPELPRLTSCSPNPFNPETTITFMLPEAARAKVTVYDLRGRKIRVLLESDLPEGLHSLSWDGKADDGRELASGVYILKLVAGGKQHSRKVTLLK